ncbi:MAG: hypothetical protein IJ017_07800 [Oscillospiraceae bacterium]|nr:hypothetical protein [Oscillospiraceae bacterium]
MSKLKVFLTVIPALALICIGAFFPKIIAKFLDIQNTGNASYNPIESVRLEIKTDIPSLGKLAMLSSMDSNITISESKANMTTEEVMEAVYSGLQPYIDSQLLTYAEYEVYMQPSLVQSSNNQNLQGIVWWVTISGEPSDYCFLDLAIDDETGQILRINYSVEDPTDNIGGLEALYILSDIYFSGLSMNYYENYAVPDLEDTYVGDNTVAIRYRFGDVVYGEVNVDMYVHEHGFYMEFPNV